ncbi:hypothetical protein [Bacillus mycoides]|uniref:hypothetical protein n=1 Tax=Bacillus mycoides TaxID=1405 RepID=UPI003F7BE707
MSNKEDLSSENVDEIRSEKSSEVFFLVLITKNDVDLTLISTNKKYNREISLVE